MKTATQNKAVRNSQIRLGFQKACIPLEFRNDNTFPGVTGENAALTFRIGVETQTGQERIRLAPGADDNVIRVLDVDQSKNQMVLLVKEPKRTITVPDGWDPKTKKRTFRDVETPSVARRVLLGMDESHLFVSQLPQAPITTVKQAHNALRPQAVSNTQGWKRQGEWFFVPATVGEQKILADNPDGCCQQFKGATVHDGTTTGRNRSTRSNKPHRADDVMYFYGDPASRPAKSPRPAPMAVIRPTKVFVRGRILHPDHKVLKLKGWHRVMLNLEVIESSARGWTNFVD